MRRSIGFSVLVVGLSMTAVWELHVLDELDLGRQRCQRRQRRRREQRRLGVAGTSSTGGVSNPTGSSRRALRRGAASSSANGTTGGSSTGAAGYTVSTLAGSGVMGGGNCGAWGADAVFSPQLLAVDGAGNIYSTGDELDRIAPDGGLTALGRAESSGKRPGGHGRGRGVLFTDLRTSRATRRSFQVMGSMPTTIFDQPASCTDTGAGAGLGQVAGIAVDSQGNIYVADEGCFRVRKVAPNGSISPLAGTGTQGDTNGPGSMAEFSQLGAIAIDANGVVYVAEADTSLVREIQPDGTTSTLASGAQSVGGIAVDGSGNVFASDSEHNLIRKIDPSGHVTIIAGDGAMGLMNGPGAQAEFNTPEGVGVDGQGNIYGGADGSNCLIRVVSPRTVGSRWGRSS